MTILNFTSSNASLEKVSLFSSKKDWVSVSLKLVTAEERNSLRTILTAIAPDQAENLPENFEETSCGVFRFKNGAFDKTYPMSLQSNKDGSGLAVEFDRQVFELTNFEGMLVSISKEKLEKYEEPTMSISLPGEDDSMIELPLPLRLNKEAFQNYRENGDKFIKMLQLSLMKGNYAKIAANLVVAEVKNGGSGGTISKFSDLTPLTEYPLTNVETMDINGRTAYVLTLGNNSEGEPLRVWSNYQTTEKFKLGATINENTTLSFVEYTNGSGKLCADVTVSNYTMPEVDPALASLFS